MSAPWLLFMLGRFHGPSIDLENIGASGYMVPLWLLVFVVACAVSTLLLCGIARVLFPRFRSGEYKPGPHRVDLPTSGREIKTIELPLVGGPAMIISLIMVGIASGYIFKFSQEQWTLMLIGLGATLGYALLGLFDDWHKVFSEEGLSQRMKLVGILFISALAGLLYFFLLDSGRQSYTPYVDLPFIGHLLCPVRQSQLPYCQVPLTMGEPGYYIWLILLMLITSGIGAATSLSVDFSDGLDGLAGGLVFSAAVAFGIIITGNLNNPAGIVMEILSLLCASSVLGYLPWNWPSSWAARRGTAKRKARIIMGDSGALGLGGILAMVAIFSRQEYLLLMIGGAFVLEGLSALVNAKLMTPFFRRRLKTLRFSSMREHVPHTEFPLPFLATPLHHHFDLLGWDRRRLVYGAWALGACFAVLGVMVGLAPETWQRYLGRILVLILAWLVWSSGSWTRRYFVGKHPAERSRRRRLALFYGYPYSLMGWRLHHLVEVIEANEDVIETPAEELALWQRMNIYDARAMLGLFCYRAGYYPAALAQWTRIPEVNRALRPEIARLLAEVDTRLELEHQETQPLKRDQILRESTMFARNVAPADLPNPHEPVSNEKMLDGHLIWAAGVPDSPFAVDEDESDEERHSTALSAHQNGNAHSSNGKSPVRSPDGATASGPARQETRQNWFARLIHGTPEK